MAILLYCLKQRLIQNAGGLGFKSFQTGLKRKKQNILHDCNPCNTYYVYTIRTTHISASQQLKLTYLENIVHYIDGCQKGNNHSRRWLYERYKGYALKIVFRFIYRYDNAVSVVNDGFVKAFNHFDQFRYESENDAEKMLMAWLKKIMIHTAIDELRRNKMTPEIGGIQEDAWDISKKNDDADQQILYKDVMEVLKKLPPLYRSIFNLYVIDGYNHIEIAELLKIPVGTSKSGLSRARLLLQQKITQLEDKSYAVSG